MEDQDPRAPSRSAFLKAKRRATVERIAGAHLASMDGTMAEALGQSNRQRLVWLPCLLAAISLLPLPALAGKTAAHVHGVASLEVAIDGGTLTLQFETPLANLLGFEHAPRNEKQKQAVRAMADRLREAGAVFTPSPAAR